MMALCRRLLKNYATLLTQKSPVSSRKQCISYSSVQNKYDKSTIDAIKRWNTENLDIYGPLLKNSKDDENSTLNSKRHQNQQVKIEQDEILQVVSTSTGHDQESSQNITPASTTESISDPDGRQNAEEKLSDFRDAGTQTEAPEVSKLHSPPPARSITYAEAESTVDLSGLLGIVSYPLFPPDRTEFYVNPPELPAVYIPGHSERSSFSNPFYPSVGTILSATQTIQSRMALKRWQENLVRELGVEGFRKHKKEILSRGVDFHACVQRYLEGAPLSDIAVTTENHGYWNSAQGVLKDVDGVLSTEKVVVHHQLCYRGQYDCMAQYRGQQVIIDWKTSKKTKSDIRYTYDNPLQVAAYLGAHNFSKDASVMVDKALIVVCYEDGQPADTHLISRKMCVDYWSQWLQRLHQYWTQKLSG